MEVRMLRALFVALALSIGAGAMASSAHARVSAPDPSIAALVEQYNNEHFVSRWLEATEVRWLGSNRALVVARSCSGPRYFTLSRHCSRSEWTLRPTSAP
jgi:hypothetical protein